MRAHHLETIPAEEEADLKKLLKLQMMFMKADETRRGQHGKSHGCVKMEFRVRPDVPGPLARGVFASQATFLGLIRFSNGGGQDDTGKDAHGMAIKLLDVDGEKVLPDDGATTQDFILADCPVFFCKKPGDVASFMQAQIKARGGPPVAWFEEHPHEAAIFQEKFLTQAGSSPLVMQYYSQTPYLLGETAVKYFARPAADNPAPADPGTTPDYLRDALREGLAGGQARFEFGVQQRVSPESEPIEDPTIEWQTPGTVLADIVIAAQEFDTDVIREFDEHLTFSPWQALEAHRPLGGVNRARRIIYESSSRKRHEVNSVPRTEPTVMDLPW